MPRKSFFALIVAAAIWSVLVPSASGQAGRSECPRGTRQTLNGCVAIQIPENAELDIFGHDWTCKRGYRGGGGRCVAVQIPENAELDVFGHDWTCKRGFRNVGSRCVAVQIPENAELDVLVTSGRVGVATATPAIGVSPSRFRRTPSSTCSATTGHANEATGMLAAVVLQFGSQRMLNLTCLGTIGLAQEGSN
jgi:hypothetical protein